MKIETFYADIKTSEKLNKIFSLPYSGQDWEIVNADDEKVNDFIKYYLDAEETQEKVTIFALLIASIDMLDQEIDVTNAWNRIKLKVDQNLKYHLSTIVYWALIGKGKNKEHIFMMTKYMRIYLSESIDTDNFEIKNPTIEGIEINGINFSSLLKEDQFLKSFPEFIQFINKEIEPEDENFDLSEHASISFEKEKDFTHFEIWSSKVGLNYLKVKTSEFEKEIKKYEL